MILTKVQLRQQEIYDNEVKCSVCEMNRSDRKNDWASGKLLSEWHKMIFKRHARILCFNAQNATVEGGFSLLSRIRTKLCNRLSVPVIDMLLRLRLSTANYQDFDFHHASQCYGESKLNISTQWKWKKGNQLELVD
uniref:Transposase n=1 Tax=Romanomermis culicivorax TaxID=13658 RepID=A0A915K0F2_ROMCU